MHDRPAPAELLDAARRVLEEELLPHLPAEKAALARQVAEAMAIAAREHAQSEESLKAEFDGLLDVMRLKTFEVEGRLGLEHAVVDLNQRLKQEIRQGRFDRDRPRQRLREHLFAVTLDKVRVTRPQMVED